VTVSGQIPRGSPGLNHVAETGNGHAYLPGPDRAQYLEDRKNGKSFNFPLSVRPRWMPGQQVRFASYHDYPAGSDINNRGELNSTVHVVCANSNSEFLNEGMWVRHSGSMTGTPSVFHCGQGGNLSL
jgi:hypothetical protein